MRRFLRRRGRPRTSSHVPSERSANLDQTSSATMASRHRMYIPLNALKSIYLEPPEIRAINAEAVSPAGTTAACTETDTEAKTTREALPDGKFPGTTYRHRLSVDRPGLYKQTLPRLIEQYTALSDYEKLSESAYGSDKPESAYVSDEPESAYASDKNTFSRAWRGLCSKTAAVVRALRVRRGPG